MSRIFYSIFAILLASPVFVSAGGNMTDASYTLDLNSMDPFSTSHRSPVASGVSVLPQILGSIADILLFMIPIIAAFSFLIAGYFYIFSAGDSEKTGRAKTIIKWNIIAMLMAFLSYAIITLIARIFS